MTIDYSISKRKTNSHGQVNFGIHALNTLHSNHGIHDDTLIHYDSAKHEQYPHENQIEHGLEGDENLKRENRHCRSLRMTRGPNRHRVFKSGMLQL